MMLSLRARWGPWGKVSDGRDGCACEDASLKTNKNMLPWT